MSLYKNKYLKYKIKYLNLCNTLTNSHVKNGTKELFGGAAAHDDDDNDVFIPSELPKLERRQAVRTVTEQYAEKLLYKINTDEIFKKYPDIFFNQMSQSHSIDLKNEIMIFLSNHIKSNHMVVIDGLRLIKMKYLRKFLYCDKQYEKLFSEFMLVE
jgi:hypothetical protein